MADTLNDMLRQAQAENQNLRRLIALRDENSKLRLQLQVPGSDDETVAAILGLVCERFCVTHDQLQSSCREEFLVLPRHMAFWLIRQHVPLSLQAIGRIMGGFDHGTVRNGCEQIRARMEDPKYSAKLAAIVKEVETFLRAKATQANGATTPRPWTPTERSRVN